MYSSEQVWWIFLLFGFTFLPPCFKGQSIDRYNVTIKTCCEHQSSFFNGSCLNPLSNVSEYFPKDNFQLFVSNSVISIALNLSTEDLFCPSGSRPVQLVINGTGESSSPFFSAKGNFLVIEKDVYSPEDFCLNKLDSNSLEIIVCKRKCNKEQPCVPLCCGSIRPTDYKHLGSCHSNKRADMLKDFDLTPLLQEPNNNSSNTLKITQNANFYISRLPCIAQGRTYSTRISNDFNDLIRNTTEENADAFCLLTIFEKKRKETNSNYFEIAYCGEEWPYEQFGLTLIEGNLYGISSAISIFFTTFGIIIYLALWQKQSIHTWTQFCYILTLLGEYICIVLAIYVPQDKNTACGIQLLILKCAYYYFGIATFVWLDILSFDLFISFWRLKPNVGQSQGSFKRLYAYIAIGWTSPFLVILGTILGGLHMRKAPTEYCIPVPMWIGELAAALAVLLNIGFFISTFIQILKHRKNSQFASQNASRKQNQLYSLFGKLFLITGITFSGVIMEVISKSARNRTSFLLLAFRTLICLQGLVVFTVYLCNKKTWLQLIHHYPCLKPLGNIGLHSFYTSSTSARSTNNIPLERKESEN